MSSANDDPAHIEILTHNEEETAQLGADVALVLSAGDMIGLSGDLGTGKSVFCRGAVRQLANDLDLEVSSPTYTLCNNYDTNLPIAHYDLYRLGSTAEVEEIGIEDALEEGCVLVEWPEKGFETLPAHAVLATISEKGADKRTIRFTGNLDLLERIYRSVRIRAFLNASNHAGAIRKPMPADASVRRYELISLDQQEPMLLMDAPRMPDGPPVSDGKPYSAIAHLAESVTPFVAIGMLLHDQGLGAPAIPASDLEQGLVLIEHMGSETIIDADRRPIRDRYMLAIEYLANLHQHQFAPKCLLPDGGAYTIPRYDAEAMMIEAKLLIDWYAPAFAKTSISEEDQTTFQTLWQELISKLQSQEESLVLRDYHSPNIIWRPEREGLEKVGVIDFQDSLIGPTAYDVASIVQDARVDIPPDFQDEMLSRYIELRKHNNAMFDEENFRTGFAIMAAQRATKILGIFVRLDRRDGKPEYLQHLPRIQAYLGRSLQHPALSRYREWIESVIEL